MELAHRVALNGVQLDEIDDRINIKSVEEGSGRETISATPTAVGYGQRITSKRRDTLDIVVKFSMLIDYTDMQSRAELLERVIAWAAGGGYLTLNYKPNRRVSVILAQAPGGGDQYEWNSVYSLTFRAYGVPYWEEEAPRKASTGTTTAGNFWLDIGGSAETVADITIANKSGAMINNVVINASGQIMIFENLGMTGSESLKIRHTAEGLLKITVGNRSAMANRKPESANDIRMQPGAQNFAFSADRACQMTVECRGRFV